MATPMADDPEVQKQLQMMQEIEIEMMSDMYNRLTKSCYKKCIPPAYKEAEVAKGEAVCIDRCVAKYLDIHDKVGKKLQQITLQDTQKLLPK